MILKEKFTRDVQEGTRVSDRVMSLKQEVESVMLNFVSGYDPRVGCELKKEEEVRREMDEVVLGITSGESGVGADTG